MHKAMRMVGLLSAAALMGFAALGCTVQQEETAPKFKKGGGQAAGAQAPAYPQGPFGYSVGSIIPNMEFLGYPNYTVTGELLHTIRLSDFHNPTGVEVFSEDLAGYGAGTPKPRALNMIISSTWCGPCQDEAANVLPDLYEEYKPIGGHFLTILIDGPEPGVPSTLQDMFNWADYYDIDYTMTMDPTAGVMAYYEPFFPGNIIIRTSDMAIIKVVAGVPNYSFWKTFDRVLDGTFAFPQ